jgi:hypothetical protein
MNGGSFMGKMVYSEIDVTKGVPQEVKDRAIKRLNGRPINYSDIPELDTDLPQQISVTLTLNAAQAHRFTSIVRNAHHTPSEVVTEMVRHEMAYA